MAVRESTSFADYWRMPADARAEFVDGEVVMAPPPSFRHQEIAQRLFLALHAVLVPPRLVVQAVGWQLEEFRRYRIPDLMVLASPPEGDLVTAPPLVVIEVLSGNRHDDLVRKTVEYARAGARQYWVVDPREQTVDVYVLADGVWVLRHRLGPAGQEGLAPEVEVPVAEAVEVHLSHARLFD